MIIAPLFLLGLLGLAFPWWLHRLLAHVAAPLMGHKTPGLLRPRWLAARFASELGEAEAAAEQLVAQPKRAVEFTTTSDLVCAKITQPAQLAGLPVDSLNALSTGQFAALTTSQVAALTVALALVALLAIVVVVV